MDNEKGKPVQVSSDGLVISDELLEEAADLAFAVAMSHLDSRERAPFQGRAQAIGACQMNMSAMIHACHQGQSMELQAQRLAGAAIYAIATQLAVFAKMKEEQPDGAGGSAKIISIDEAIWESTRGGDSAGVGVRRPTPPNS